MNSFCVVCCRLLVVIIDVYDSVLRWVNDSVCSVVMNEMFGISYVFDVLMRLFVVMLRNVILMIRFMNVVCCI